MLTPEEIRERSWAEILAHGGISNPGLPLLIFTDERPRTAREAVRRLFALMAVGAVAAGQPLDVAQSFLDDNQLEDELSPTESAFMSGKVQGKHELAALSWTNESIVSLVWSLGLIPSQPLHSFERLSLVDFAPGPDDLLGDEPWSQATLRPAEELVAELDRTYCWHWCARELGHSGAERPEFDFSLAWFRRKPLEWLLDADLDWDDVRSDT